MSFAGQFAGFCDDGQRYLWTAVRLDRQRRLSVMLTMVDIEIDDQHQPTNPLVLREVDRLQHRHMVLSPGAWRSWRRWDGLSANPSHPSQAWFTQVRVSAALADGAPVVVAHVIRCAR
jgi:hypothetical protein